MGQDGEAAEPDERVSVASLHAYCIRLCEAAGMPGKDAATLATFLVEQDVVQGGRMSHGTRCLAGVAATDRPGWQDYLGIRVAPCSVRVAERALLPWVVTRGIAATLRGDVARRPVTDGL